MSFDSILKTLAVSSGASGALLLDWEGELVASFVADPSFELDLIGAHHGIILDIIKDTRLPGQDPDEVKNVLISTGNTKLCITAIKENYYVVVLQKRAKLGSKAIYASRRAVMALEKEMG